MENETSINTLDLDEIDYAIIQAMRRDGRTSFAQIAEQLGVSPGMIRLRYNRLVEAGLLKIVAITNPLGLGYTTMAVIGIRADGARLLEVAESIAALEEVIYLIVVSGRYDIIAEVMCRDRDHLLQFLTERLYKVEGVRETETFMHLKIVKEVYF
ncbi:MAG: Lrp/AsnC family transcriptional regulator [Anaerolineales bacterium]|nr:Lrp/AsnC family transcriptional regulator [Anaerolineales bacterium]MDW8227452.1 Lrp/AsnC family transcriptional regulator [Anaerolineales bacterium]